jgi:uncharacterized phage protein (TIGR01671 family)
MRDIRFRGYSQKYEQWLFGSLDKDANGEPVIRYWVKDADGCHSNHAIKVIPETVGQFTGLLDKNGKEIYEGDIVNCTFENRGICTVEFSINDQQTMLCQNQRKIYDLDYLIRHYCEVIGNIHERSDAK